MKPAAYDGHGEDEVLALDERGGSTYVPDTLKGYVEPPKNRTTWIKQSRNLYHPSPAGRNDPLSVMCVVELLMRLRPTDIIRAKFLVALLEQIYPQITWNAVTVGVILGELSELAEENFVDEDRRPLYRKRDWRGNWWKLRVTADAWKWFFQLREYAGRAAESEIRKERRGELPLNRSGSVWANLPPRIVT